MKGHHPKIVLAGCMIAAAFGMSSARAAGGTISFSGAIVEPTCAFVADLAPTLLPVAELPAAARRVACAGAGGVTIAAPQAYAVTVVRLSIDTTDPLLRYFNSYVQVGAFVAADAGRLVTQTYE